MMSGSVVLVSEAGGEPYAVAITARHHVMTADEPESLGGSDSGMSPYELVMAALGSCTAMTLRMTASRNHWPVDNITVEVRHEKVPLADGKKTDRFERNIQVFGKLTEEQRARLIAASEKCPVSQTLQRPSIVKTQMLWAGPLRHAEPAPQRAGGRP
jgi:putative redox protein